MAIPSGGERVAKILLADDAPQSLERIRAMLTVAGYEVSTARDGEETLLNVETESPDLILLDAMTPKLTGLQVCARLKQDGRKRLIPVIMLSSDQTKKQRMRSFEAGADDLLPKPVSRVELLARIGSLVGSKLLNEEMVGLEKAILALAIAIEAKDPYSRGHLERVSSYSARLGEKVGLSRTDKQLIKRAAILHDVGKIGIKESILLKAGPLSREEFDHIKEHCAIGERICQPLGDRLILDAVRHHHERFDGSGYPDGIKGSEIPLSARIMTIADAYDALTHDRPYRKGFHCDKALSILRDEVGRQFDPELALSFISMVESECFPGECSPEV